MAFIPKAWVNGGTLTAAALIDMETRLAAYSDTLNTRVFNVKNYGAVGDGATDDSTAIHAALTAAAPTNIVGTPTTTQTGTIYFPAGNYITTPLVLSQRVRLQGEGMGVTTLTMKSGQATYANLITNYQAGAVDSTAACSQFCSVSDMTLDGNSFGNAGTWQSGIVFVNNSGTSGQEFVDGRHQVSNILIKYFTGDGIVQHGRGGEALYSNVLVFGCDGFGFNVAVDGSFVNCSAGACGIDGWIVQGNPYLSCCSGWFAGNVLVSNAARGTSTTLTTRNAPSGSNPWDGGNISGLVFSLANGFGNGINVTSINGSALGYNYTGGKFSHCGGQDNARCGLSMTRAGRHIVESFMADSNNNNGTNGGVANGSYAGIEIGFDSSRNRVTGISWERSANTNHQAAAVRYTSNAADRNVVEVSFDGTLNGDINNMPPLTSDSVLAGNKLVMTASEGHYDVGNFGTSFTPNPYIAETFAGTLNSATLTMGVPALAGTNGGTGIYLVPGMKLTFVFTQDGTGGRAVSWNAIYKLSWTPTTTAGKINTISFIWNGTNWVQTGGTVGL